MTNIYTTTWQSQKPHGLPEVSIGTGVLETVTGRRLLCAQMIVTGANARISIPIDAGSMRSLATLLHEHATRIAVELLPLIHQAQPDPEAIAVADPDRAGREAA